MPDGDFLDGVGNIRRACLAVVKEVVSGFDACAVVVHRDFLQFTCNLEEFRLSAFRDGLHHLLALRVAPLRDSEFVFRDGTAVRHYPHNVEARSNLWTPSRRLVVVSPPGASLCLRRQGCRPLARQESAVIAFVPVGTCGFSQRLARRAPLGVDGRNRLHQR